MTQVHPMPYPTLRSATATAMRTALLGAALVAVCQAQAADPLTDAIQRAYAPYRAALFKTNSGSATEAAAALGQASEAWNGVRQRYGQQPPLPYAADTALPATFEAVSNAYQTATQQVSAGQLPEAHETLEAVREHLAQLRQRNQVIVFSDHMNAYHAEMEHVLAHGKAWLAEPQGLQRVAAAAGVLAYLARQVREQAPPDVRQQAGYQPLLDAFLASVDALEQATRQADVAAIQQAIGGLKAPYSKLFVKFG